MNFNGKLFLVAAYFMTVGCTAKIVKVVEDDLSDLTKFRGGIYSCESRSECANGRQKAIRICNGRPMIELGTTKSERTELGFVPVPNTTYSSGSVFSGATSVNYYGSTTSTNYVPFTWTTETHKISFMCQDGDIKEKVFYLGQKNSTSAILCQEVPSEFTPGHERMWRVSHSPTSQSCTKEGWFSFIANGQRYYIFKGIEGLNLCKSVENEIARTDAALSLNKFMSERLTCNDSKLANEKNR